MNIRQFCLWTNCNNRCNFCYLQNVKQQPVQEKLAAIALVKRYIQENIDFDTLGLIGGEFFQGQLHGCKAEFFDLIRDISNSDHITQVWITASLMTKKQDSLYEVIDILKNKDVYICTSYDVEGRFKNEDVWWANYRSLYNKVKLHTEIIYTDAFCSKLVDGDTSFIDEIIQHSFLNFKLPNLYVEDYIDFKNNISIENYITVRNRSVYMPNFFLSERSKFLKSVRILNEKGINVLKALNHSSADYIYYNLPCNYTEKDKWHIGADSNAPCGHFWDNFSYLDSNNCITCDLEALYKDL